MENSRLIGFIFLKYVLPTLREFIVIGIAAYVGNKIVLDKFDTELVMATSIGIVTAILLKMYEKEFLRLHYKND